jgi:hypothetical protein
MAVSGLRRSWASESVMVCNWCMELSMRSSMRLRVRARWLTSSLRLVVGTLAVRSEWPMREAASVILRTWLNMRRVVRKTMVNPSRTMVSHRSRKRRRRLRRREVHRARRGRGRSGCRRRCERRRRERGLRILERGRRWGGPRGIFVAWMDFKWASPLPAPTHSLSAPSLPA